ncbi:MAG: polysaccharide biosynthesis protein [Anaerolineae bacterium]
MAFISDIWHFTKTSLQRLAARLELHLRNRHLIIWDILVQPGVVYLAMIIRLETARLGEYRDAAFQFSILCALVMPVVFYLTGLYRRFWRYASLREAELILISSVVAELSASAVYILILTPLGFTDRIPYSIPVIATFLLIVGVTIPRYAIRLSHLLRAQGHNGGGLRNQQRVLLAGAGNAGMLILREIRANPDLGYQPVGFVDDDPHKLGLEIMGCRVLGKTSAIPDLVKQLQVNRVLLCMPRAGGVVIRRLTQICQQANVSILTVPGIYEILAGTAVIRRLRPIQVDDLLRRPPVEIDQTKVKALLGGHTILVTGAGGSIGSEICRQVAGSNPARLVLLGHGENSIYHIEQELRRYFPGLAVEAVIADLRDRSRLDQVISRWQPTTILHAAAHKHVPLMESNAPDAVTNNIFGTLNLVESAIAQRVSHLVMISSDKAVNPANVMGTTKRVAELIVQDAARRSGLAFTTVRFGNVLGSNGSVVPLFQKQIEHGGPVTITDAEMRRYFMTVQEAVRLVLQAATMGQGGEIYVLDMGDPIKIVDLARDMIALSGLEAGKDIEIVYTGLRPGEKLFEEISVHNEHHVPSPHRKIYVLRQDEDSLSGECLSELPSRLGQLRAAVQAGDVPAILQALREIVPECTLADYTG